MLVYPYMEEYSNEPLLASTLGIIRRGTQPRRVRGTNRDIYKSPLSSDC